MWWYYVFEHVLWYWFLVYIYQNATTALTPHVVGNVVRNQMIVAPLTTWVMIDMDRPDTIPTWECIIMYVLHGVAFYYIHKLFHYPDLYRRFHYIHHEFNEVQPYAAMYCHPVEHALCNVFPVLLGPMVFGSGVTFIRYWIGLATLVSVHSHCTATSHATHHRFRVCNFGTGDWMDYIHDTLHHHTPPSRQ